MKDGIFAVLLGGLLIGLGLWSFDASDTSSICARGFCNSGSSVSLSMISAGVFIVGVVIRNIYRAVAPKKEPTLSGQYRGATPYGSLRKYEAHLRKIGVAEQQIQIELKKYQDVV
jgi:hypothetical protein